ncbi:MAG: LLM class flavin-dependent oxidoreductase [Anaerolineae bacterium]|nr:LLM class flavin-dependent oxidoreductase [Anaerolineae bacterium]
MSDVKYGIVLPVYDIQTVIEYATDAEKAGWDGYFVADVAWGLDAWVCLTAAAARTKRIHLGTLLTPLSVMKPWKVAAQVATLDQLAKGRVILSVGMGAIDVGFAQFGEAVDLKTRAERVDEALEIIGKLWHGEAFQHTGKHYQLDVQEGTAGMPAPVEIPVWMVAAWPRPKSMQRALRCDGVIPYIKPKGEGGRTPEPSDLQDITAWVRSQPGANKPQDYIIEGTTAGNDEQSLEKIRRWRDVGMTWWIESLWDVPHDQRVARLKQGPPRI